MSRDRITPQRRLSAMLGTGRQRAQRKLNLKRKVDICFKQKRPKYVQAINRMVDNAIINEKSLIEDSVKKYKGYE